MNNNFYNEQARQLIKNCALEALKKNHPNEAKLSILTDKLHELIHEMKSLPLELRAEAQDLFLIEVSREFGVI